MLELRLLQVFTEIYQTSSVSRAADILGIGQPAVSVALAKLREHFGDPLFVRIANTMEPTPLAKELAQPVLQALQAMERVCTHRAAFDPATSSRRFRICMSDINQLVLLPKLLAHLRRTAPGVHLDVVPLSEHMAKMLESGEADLAFGYLPHLEAGFYQQTLFRQRYVCVVSMDHPRIHDSLTLAQFEAEEHAVVALSGAGYRLILDEEIARQNITRKIALQVPSHLGIVFVIEQTDLLVTIPERVVQLMEGRARFRTLPVPFEMPEFSIKQHWHERYHHDPGNCWLRQSISDLLSAT